MQATIEEKRATAIAAARKKRPASVTSDRTKKSSTPLEAKAPKPFFVPALRNRSYNSVMPDVAVATKGKPHSPKVDWKSTHSAHSNRPKSPASAHQLTPPRAASKPDAASPSPDPSPSTGRTIRILGKNGEIAFVDLTSLPKAYPKAPDSVKHAAATWVGEQPESKSRDIKKSHSPIPKSGHYIKQSMIPAVSDKIGVKQNKNQDDQWVTPAVSDRISVKQNQNLEDQWATTSRTSGAKQHSKAPSAVMSGALPMATGWPQSAVPSAGQSCKDSGVAMGGVSAVASKVGSVKTTSIRSGSAISQGVFSFAKQIANMPSTPSNKPKSASAAPAPQLFEEVGMGVTTGFPVQKGASERSNRSAAGHQQFGSPRSSQRNADKALPSEKAGFYQPTSERSNRTAGHQNPPSETAGFQESGSLRGSQRITTSNAPSPKSNQEFSRQASRHSNYKPPTVHSANSSSSVTHAFGGFQHDGFVQQADTPVALHHARQSPIDHHQVRSESSKSKKQAANSTSVKSTPAFKHHRPEIHLDTANIRTPVEDWRSPDCPSHSPISPLASPPHVPIATKQQTKFAGDGWISPHPLSVASTDFGAPPQSAVYISTDGPGHCATLTYTQWRAQRDAVESAAGSFAGSHVPSAVELQTVTPAVYNHPPPASYVGSYNQRAARPREPRSQASYSPGWHAQDGHRALDLDAANQTLLVQEQRQSLHSRASLHSGTHSVSTRHNDLVYKDSVHRAPSVLAQDAGWDLPLRRDGSALGSGHSQAASYYVGLTPSELAKYQNRLSSTVSRYSSQLSHVQQEQAPPQPNYDVWNSGKSHATVRAASHHSAQALTSDVVYLRETIQLAMPWDQASSHAGSHTALSNRARSQHAGSTRGDGYNTPNAQGPSSAILAPLRVDNNSHVSIASQSLVNVPRSQASYGTAKWQDLEDAEDGQGRFQSRQDYRTW